MLRSAVLRHFRGFEDFALDLGAVSVLIGRNSSGKTSVLQAIRIAYSVAQFAAESEDATPRMQPNGNLQVCDRLIISDPGRLIALSDWRQIFLNGEVGEGVRSTLALTFDPGDSLQSLHVSLWYGRNAQLTATVDVIGPSKHLIIPRTADDRLAEPTSLVADAHAVGLGVTPWTFRAENRFLPAKLRRGTSPAEHGDAEAVFHALYAAGVDGVFSDFPALAVAARN